MKVIHKCFYILMIFFVASSLVGCEKISEVVSSFKGKKDSVVLETLSVEEESSSKVAEKPMKVNVLARIGAWSITKEEFEDRLTALKQVVPEYDVDDPKSRRLVLDELVRQQLLVEDAKKTGLTNQKDITAAIEEFKRTLIVREVARQLTENLKVSDEEAKSFYEENKKVLISPVQYHVREIILESQLKANEVMVEILKGLDFAQLAKTSSVGKSADSGGDLGFIDNVAFPEMGNALLSLDEGDSSSIFRGPEGFYIIKLEEKKGGETLVYEDIKDQIIQSETLRKQQEAILLHIKNLEEKIKVEINEDLL